ncbi:MAG TPA: hypothetical protein PLJ60_06165 [Chryseolinea sp.]|nr:hypothetical protein [Chryseolinea sp.]HPM29903.1 hypothetical protein [Chryseolinea sp.]
MIKKITASAFIVLLLSGCALHFGALQSSVALNQANFKVVKTASGSAQTKVVFGIGGLKQEALVAEARKDLNTKANLTEGQVLANLTMDYKTTFYPPYIPVVLIQKVTITADVIEFAK